MPKKRRVTHKPEDEMTTTITLPMQLMQRAKVVAIQRQTSFKALVEEGLRLVLARPKEDT